MSVFAVIGWARVGKRCMKQAFNGVVEFANDTKAVFGVEPASDMEHSRFAINPVSEAGIAALAF